jgi:hypothetical protein
MYNIKFLVILLLQNIFFIFCNAQNNKLAFFYSIKRGVTLSEPQLAFNIQINKATCFFSFKPDSSFVEYANGKKDTVITNKNFGPYRFIRKKEKVYLAVKQKNRWLKQDYYLLKTDTTFLIPDIFSTTIDSYNIKCKLLEDSNQLEVNGRIVSVFRFAENYYSNISTLYRIVYISKKTLLPIKFVYYTNSDYQKISNVIECKNCVNGK